MISSGSKIGDFSIVLEFHLGGSATIRTTLSSFISNSSKTFTIFFLKAALQQCTIRSHLIWIICALCDKILSGVPHSKQ